MPTTVHALCLDLARESTSRVERYLLLTIADRAEARQVDADREERRARTSEARRHERKTTAAMDRSSIMATVAGLFGAWYSARVSAKPAPATSPAN